MQLRSVDFNLLLPLRTLLEERSVSRAAERMHMSQPALSAALARLRRHFGDELLERRGNSYDLTPLAVQLLELSHSASLSMERVFTAQAEFDPTTSTREFSIFSSDYGMAVLGGALCEVLGEVAPGVRLRFNNMSTTVVNNTPDSLRDYDGLFMPHGFLDIPHQDMFGDRWVCLVSADNDRVGDSLQLEQLSELDWVFTFSGHSEYTPAAKQMQMLGIEARITRVTPSFLVMPELIVGSNRIGLVQQTLARRIAATPALRILDCPFDVVPLTEAFWWNAVHERDPEHVWLRSLLPIAVERAGLSPA